MTAIASVLWGLRLIVRGLVRQPSTLLLMTLTLALGIGANTAVFSVAWGAWLKPLPYPDGDRLVLLSDRHESFLPGDGGSSMSIGNYWEITRASQSLESFAAFRATRAAFGENNRPVSALIAEPGFFNILGLPMTLGRGFDLSDVQGGTRVAIVSYSMWVSELGSDPSAAGREITIAGSSWELVGVAPRDFEFAGDADLFVPLRFSQEQIAQHGGRSIRAIGRIAPGVTLETVRSETQRHYSSIAEQFPEAHDGWTSWTSPLSEFIVGKDHGVLALMLAAGGLLFLIACANVASLLLTRAEGRRKEIAVRFALGASRSRMVSAFLGESIVLGLIGGALGVVVAYGGIAILLNVFGDQLARDSAIGVNPVTLAVGLLLTLATSLMAGAVPAVRMGPGALATRLRGSARSLRRNNSFRVVLIASEVLLAVVLVSGTGLLLNTVWRLTQADLGFEPDGAVIVNLEIPPRIRGDSHSVHEFFREALEALEGSPEILTSSASDRVPPSGQVTENGVFAAGRPENTTDFVVIRQVTAGYFRSAGIRIEEGSSFAGWIPPSDGSAVLPVVINRVLADALFPASAVIGREITAAGSQYRVVGISGSVHQNGANRAAQPAVYFPWPASPLQFADQPTILIRSEGGDGPSLAVVREVVLGIDPDVRFTAEPLTARLDWLYGDQEFAVSLLGIFAILAITLGAVGIYGVLSQTVTERTHEVGVRLALGADRGAVVRMVIMQGLRITALGLLPGLLVAAGLSRSIEALLYGISPLDPTTFAAVGAFFLVVSVASCWLPARRAARIAPTEAMEVE